MQEKSQPVSFGVSGTGMIGAAQEMPQAHMRPPKSKRPPLNPTANRKPGSFLLSNFQEPGPGFNLNGTQIPTSDHHTPQSSQKPQELNIRTNGSLYKGRPGPETTATSHFLKSDSMSVKEESKQLSLGFSSTDLGASFARSSARGKGKLASTKLRLQKEML